MILQNPLEEFDGSLIQNKFALRFFGTNALRIGNLLIFDVKSDKTIFAWEIPDISIMSNILFKKLFIVNLTNILSKEFDKNLFIDVNDNIYEKGYDDSDGILTPYENKLSTVVLNNRIISTALGYIEIDRLVESKKEIEKVFYDLLDNCFLESFQ